MNKINIIYFFNIFSFILCQNNQKFFNINSFPTTFYSENQQALGTYISCLNESSSISEKIKNRIINAYEKYDGSILTVLNELFKTDKETLTECFPIKNEDEYYNNINNYNYKNEFYKNIYNWKLFFECLYNKLNNDNINEINNPVNKLIDYIKKGEFYNALKEEYQLIKHGNDIVKKCYLSK